MAAEETQPLDEIVWSSPDIVQEMGFIHTNTIQPYFARSPFFDPTSNNAVVMSQATYNPNMLYIIQTRQAFEEHLRSMAGLEFMVIYDPSANDTIREHSGIWVIRKQTRRKRAGQEDEITPHSAYFVVGDRVYMAPSVGGILESRMLSTVTKLTKLLATASSLPLFTPATGHTYYRPVKKSITAAAKDSTSNIAPSKEGTPLPDSGATRATLNLSQSSTSSASPKKPIALDQRALLQQTIQLAERFGSEYMDTMPLQGEPGAFVLKKAAAPAGRDLATAKAAGSKLSTATPTPTPSSGGLAANRPGAPAIAPLQTDLAEDEHKRKIAGGGVDRSPTTGTPITPSGTKKRKKSRIGGLSGGKITPTSAA